MRRGALRPARAQRRAPMRSLRPYLQGGSAARALENLAEPKVFDSLVRLLCCLPRHSRSSSCARARWNRNGKFPRQKGPDFSGDACKGPGGVEGGLGWEVNSVRVLSLPGRGRGGVVVCGGGVAGGSLGGGGGPEAERDKAEQRVVWGVSW